MKTTRMERRPNGEVMPTQRFQQVGELVAGSWFTEITFDALDLDQLLRFAERDSEAVVNWLRDMRARMPATTE